MESNCHLAWFRPSTKGYVSYLIQFYMKASAVKISVWLFFSFNPLLRKMINALLLLLMLVALCVLVFTILGINILSSEADYKADLQTNSPSTSVLISCCCNCISACTIYSWNIILSISFTQELDFFFTYRLKPNDCRSALISWDFKTSAFTKTYYTLWELFNFT